ncbi:MAG TPA: lipid II flippase MurJ [Candidatus Deferrimicrobium sp.]|nr:lipid II flippase MurJ [Candidatus Deferrimicrobium sp.]
MSPLVKQSLVAASLVTIITNILGRGVGYIREAVIAGYFGTSATYDTFLLAFTIPELISFILFAALPATVIPWMKRRAPRDAQEETNLFWSGLLGCAITFGLLAAVIYLLRGSILTVLGPKLVGLERDTGARLAGIVAPFIFFRGMEAYVRSYLFDKKHFVVPATSPIVANLATLAAMFLLYEKLNIDSLAWGWLTASVIVFAYNGLYALHLVGPPDWSGLTVRPLGMLLKLAAGACFLESITLVYPAIDRFLAAAYLGPGQIAALRYATFLIHLPTGMFVVSFSLASFPWISDLSSPADSERLRKLYAEGIRLVTFVMGLAAVAMVVFTSDIVRVSFQRGAFDDVSLALTRGPLVCFAVGILFFSVYVLQTRFYYARRLLLRLAVILGGMLAVKGLLSLILVGPLEHSGLALATSITWACGCVVMTLDCSRAMDLTVRSWLNSDTLKLLVCMAAVAALWVLMAYFWRSKETDVLVTVFVRLAVMGVLGTTLYVGLAHLLKLPESRRLIGSLVGALRPSR